MIDCGRGKVCIHRRKVGKIVNKTLRWLFTIGYSYSDNFLILCLMPFVLHFRDLITLYRSWSVPSSFLEDGHMTSGKKRFSFQLQCKSQTSSVSSVESTDRSVLLHRNHEGEK